MSGSKAAQRVAGAGRRSASAIRAGAGSVRRAHSSGRAAVAGAAAARGKGIAATAKAVRAGLAAERDRQDQQTNRKLTRLARFRRWVISAAAGTAAGSLMGGVALTRGTGRWGSWWVRAVAARLRGESAPPPPHQEAAARAAAEQQAQAQAQGHPPVADAITPPPANAGAARTQVISTGGAGQMSLGNVLEELSGQMSAAAMGYEPDGMLQWGRDMQMLEDVLANVGQVLVALEKGAEDLPVNPTVKSTLASVGGLQHACASAAAEIHATFRAVHADELDRLENPRPAEHKWDTGNNQ